MWWLMYVSASRSESLLPCFYANCFGDLQILKPSTEHIRQLRTQSVRTNAPAVSKIQTTKTIFCSWFILFLFDVLIHDNSLLLRADRIEQFVLCDLGHETVNEFDRCPATIPGCFGQLVLGALFIRIATCRRFDENKIKNHKRTAKHTDRLLETTNGRPKLASLCSNFSDKSNIWPVVYSVLLSNPELPSVFTQYLFHSESSNFRSRADLK